MNDYLCRDMSTNSPALVSIIVPVYNLADSIARCLASIMAQTCGNLEVILVDDHGSDDSIAIAHGLTDSYEGPIRFVYTRSPENSGPGVARNIGIELATGRYMAFVDGDDSVHPEFCELLAASAEKYDSDLCCCNLEMFDESGKSLYIRRNPYVADGEFAGKSRRRFLSTYVSHFTTFLYRRTLFENNHIHFPNGRIAEDSAMLCCALLCCRRISQVNRNLYFYHRHTDSLTTADNGERYLQRLSSMNMMLDTVRANGWYESDRQEIDFIYYKKGYLMAVFDLLAARRPADIAELKKLRVQLDSRVPSYKKNPYFVRRPLYLLTDMALSYCPRIAAFIYRLFSR